MVSTLTIFPALAVSRRKASLDLAKEMMTAYAILYYEYIPGHDRILQPKKEPD